MNINKILATSLSSCFNNKKKKRRKKKSNVVIFFFNKNDELRNKQIEIIKREIKRDER